MEVCPQDKRVSLEIRFDDDGKVSLARCCFLYAFSHLTLEEYGKIDDIIDYAENSKINYAKSSNICIAKCFLEKKIKQVDVGISHACNMHCMNCFFKEHKDTPEMKKAYFDTLYKIKGHQLDTIMMNNGGEVFVYYDEIIKYLKSLTPNDTRQVTFVTNLVLLNEERFKELKQISDETGVTYFFLPSVDGIKKESYEAIRLGGKFEKITENLHLLADIFGPQQAVILYTIKKPNIDELENVEKYFKDNFGIRCTISFDVYDKECEARYNLFFRKVNDVQASSSFNVRSKSSFEPVLTVITESKPTKQDIEYYSKLNKVELHCYCNGKIKNCPKNIKVFKKTKYLYEIVSYKLYTKYVLFVDKPSDFRIIQSQIFDYFIEKANSDFVSLYHRNINLLNSKLSFYIINSNIYKEIFNNFEIKKSKLYNNTYLGERVLLKKFNNIEIPNTVAAMEINNKIIESFLKKWKKQYGILPYQE